MTAERLTIDALRRSALSGLELAERLHSSDRLNAFITAPDPDRFQDDPVGPLAGVPIAIKDNICTADYRTTAASALLEDFHPPRDATVVNRLRGAGAQIFGKTNLDEFAMGGSTETSYFGPTLHPQDHRRSPGGSSGGSAAAVAAGLCPAALGSDTGGSVRQPASFCGVVGFKPTWGRVSRRGLIAFASSLDQIGWLTHSVDDAATLFELLAGPDPGDATCLDTPVPSVDAHNSPAADLHALRIGIPDRWLTRCDLSAGIATQFDTWRRHLHDQGAEIVDIDLRHADLGLPTYQVIATAEASSNLARFDGIRYGRRAPANTVDELIAQSRSAGFGREVKRRILLGSYTLSKDHYEQYFDQACRVRTLIIDDYRRAFEDVDVILTPTTPTTAFELGRRLDDPLDVYAADRFTVGPSLAGLPAISVPGKTAGQGLAFGLQLVAARFDEPRLFSAARTIETHRPQVGR